MKVAIDSMMKIIEDMKLYDLTLKKQAEQLETMIATCKKEALLNVKQLKRFHLDLIEERKQLYELMIALTRIKDRYFQCEEQVCDRVEEVYAENTRRPEKRNISFSEKDMEVVQRIRL